MPDNVAQPHAGVFRRGCHGAADTQRAHGRLLGQRARFKRRQSGRLALGSAFRLFSSYRRQVALVQKSQHTVQIHVAVQRQVAVVQAVVALVLFQVVLVGKRGDSLGRAAGLERIRRVGEQACLQLVVQHAGRIGQRAFHLVVHHAVVRKLRPRSRAGAGSFAICARFAFASLIGRHQLVVPAFLLEHLALAVDIGVQHGVHVHVGQVHEVLVVRGRDGVQRLVAERHGVQKRLHAGFQQVDERLFDREFLRSAQHGMLQDVKHPRVVGRRRAKRDGECLVVVVVLQVQQLRAADIVQKRVRRAVDFGQRLGREHGKPVQVLSLDQVHEDRLSYLCMALLHGAIVAQRPRPAPRVAGAPWFFSRTRGPGAAIRYNQQVNADGKQAKQGRRPPWRTTSAFPTSR